MDIEDLHQMLLGDHGRVLQVEKQRLERAALAQRGQEQLRALRR